jgi:hypothetical protein
MTGPPAHIATLQPIGMFPIGGGYYVRLTAVMMFDIQNDRYLVPLGLGFDKFFKAGSAVVRLLYSSTLTAQAFDNCRL